MTQVGTKHGIDIGSGETVRNPWGSGCISVRNKVWTYKYTSREEASVLHKSTRGLSVNRVQCVLTDPPPGFGDNSTACQILKKAEYERKSKPMAMNMSGLNSSIFLAEFLMRLCTSLYVTRVCTGSSPIVDC